MVWITCAKGTMLMLFPVNHRKWSMPWLGGRKPDKEDRVNNGNKLASPLDVRVGNICGVRERMEGVIKTLLTFENEALHPLSKFSFGKHYVIVWELIANWRCHESCTCACLDLLLLAIILVIKRYAINTPLIDCLSMPYRLTIYHLIQLYGVHPNPPRAKKQHCGMIQTIGSAS
jgi:hypothetical protein